MKIYFSHAKDFDFENKLYVPLKKSNLFSKHEIFLPHDGGRSENTKDAMGSFDLVIAEVSKPATGQGIELGRAEMLNVPILCISERGSKISGSLKYLTDSFIEYDNPADMIEKIASFLEVK
jgi:hypothetical protein